MMKREEQHRIFECISYIHCMVYILLNTPKIINYIITYKFNHNEDIKNVLL